MRIIGSRKHAGALSPKVEIEKAPGQTSPLPLSDQGRRHSPTGFEWGYGGSGPSALAHSILQEVCDTQVADALYQDFKREVVAGLPHLNWALSYDFVRGWVDGWRQRGGSMR